MHVRVDAKTHWEQVYATKQDSEVSWFEPLPRIFLDFLLDAGLPKDARIIDIGGGTSRLAGALLDLGYRNITVLDISEVALERSWGNLGERARQVQWIAADITRWHPSGQYDLWHDRAVFHFLTSEPDRAAYRATLQSALVPGGIAILATFALDGPERCSGLPVQRYSPENLAAELGDGFQLQRSHVYDHTTPAGQLQHFQVSQFCKQKA